MSDGNGSDNLTDAIRENATGAQQVTNDGTTTRTHSLRDQIEAAKFLRGRKRKGVPLRTFRTRPGGAA